MNFDQHDIDESKAYLLPLLENSTLSVGIDQINELIDYIAANTAPGSLKETLLLTIKSFSIAELKALEEDYLKESDFDRLILKSFQLEKRRLLKQKLIQLDSEIAEASLDETITKAFRVEKRKELKEGLKKLELESKVPGRVISMKSFFKIISIAASIILIFLIWQPQHISDKKLFATYSGNHNILTDFTDADLIKKQTGLRGEEEHFRNYSYGETLELQEAIALVKQKDYERAKEIFKRLNVEKEKNSGLALYFSIAQLNTDNLAEAIKNLEYLAKLPDFSYQDETKFHLAFAYLKSGERKKARELLNDLVKNNSKFSDQAKQIIKKLRWF